MEEGKGAAAQKERRRRNVFVPVPRRDVLLVEFHEEHKRPERDPPAQQHAGDAKGPAQAGHGEREGEYPCSDHRGEVVLFVFVFGFLFLRTLRKLRCKREAFPAPFFILDQNSHSPRKQRGPWRCDWLCPSGASPAPPWSVFFCLGSFLG